MFICMVNSVVDVVCIDSRWVGVVVGSFVAIDFVLVCSFVVFHLLVVTAKELLLEYSCVVEAIEDVCVTEAVGEEVGGALVEVVVVSDGADVVEVRVVVCACVVVIVVVIVTVVVEFNGVAITSEARYGG